MRPGTPWSGSGSPSASTSDVVSGSDTNSRVRMPSTRSSVGPGWGEVAQGAATGGLRRDPPAPGWPPRRARGTPSGNPTCRRSWLRATGRRRLAALPPRPGRRRRRHRRLVVAARCVRRRSRDPPHSAARSGRSTWRPRHAQPVAGARHRSTTASRITDWPRPSATRTARAARRRFGGSSRACRCLR